MLGPVIGPRTRLVLMGGPERLSYDANTSRRQPAHQSPSTAVLRAWRPVTPPAPYGYRRKSAADCSETALSYVIGSDAREGSGLKFEDYVAEHATGLTRLAYVLCRNADAAEDLVQTVLVTVYRRWRRVSAADNPPAYVRKMLVNAHIDASRRRRAAEVPIDERHDLADPAPNQQRVESRDELRGLLATLPEQARTILILRYYLDLSDPDIAATLGIREASVRSAASRALANLRAKTTPDTAAQLVLRKGTPS